MNTKIYLGLLVISFSIPSFAQTIFTGSVKNRAGNPMPVNVTIQTKGSVTISGFGATDSKGFYSISYKEDTDSVIVTVSSMIAGKHSKTVKNRSQRVDFVIDEQPIELKEVDVKASRITYSKDTLNYLVSAFTDQNDRVIGDVLKKMPGIEVSENGKLSFNGKDISKLYVENMDLLGGRYGIATNNISVKAVSVIQVLENHQSIKSLRDIPTDDIAINIKLKDEAKGTLAFTGLLGGGYQPLLWKAELTAMYFGKKMQNITAYKTNNSGDNVAAEFRTHYDYERVYMDPANMLYIQKPSTPPVPQKRYLYNRSHAVTANHLLKLGKDSELTTGLLYYDDRIEREGYSLFEQYLPEGDKVAIEERVNAVSQVHNAELSSRLNINADKHYINNVLNVKASWNDDIGIGVTRSNTMLTEEAITQRLDQPFFSIDNTLNLLKTVKAHSYKMYFSAGYGSKPHSLTVSPVTYLNDENVKSIQQDYLSRDLSAILRFSYGINLKPFLMNYHLWGRTDVRNMNTELHKDSPEESVEIPDSLRNDLWHNTYQAGISQTYTYTKGDLKAIVELPLTYYLLSIHDKIYNKDSRYNKLIFNPAFSLKYEYREFDFNVRGNIRRNFGNIGTNYTGFIMHGYRSFVRNTIDELFETRSVSANVGIGYKEPISEWFINLNGGYNHSWKNLLYGYDYQGIMSIRTAVKRPTESDNYNAKLNINKGLDFWSTTLRLFGSYNQSRGERLIQDEVLNFNSLNYAIGAGLNANPFSFLGINYTYTWNRYYNYIIRNSSDFPIIRQVSQVIGINVFPTEELTINIRMEQQYNSAASERYTQFADAVIKWRNKYVDIELEANNLFNAKQYVSAFYNDISTYYYNYNLRPFSVLLKFRFKL